MKRSVVWAMLFLALPTACRSVAAPAAPFECPSPPSSGNQVDKLVLQRLEKRGIQPAAVCSDGVFVRRVYLDVIGTIPTVKEANEFLLSKQANKREALIERLLARDEFADYLAMRWSDVLRIKAEFPINLWPNAAQSYHHWIRTSIRENKPYDQFVREMLTASGSNFRAPPVNFYRAMQNKEPQGIAKAVALAFMGTRAETWPRERLDGMAAFFSTIGRKSTAEWKEEIILFDPASTNEQGAACLPTKAMFPDGTATQLTADQDPREVFARWLINTRNPWFTRAIVNRVWYWVMGRGLVHEPDDFRPDNPPSNPELLAYLELELAAANYDLRHLYRLILNSRTYQLSSIGSDYSPEGEADFSHYIVRRLYAEVLIDALCQITGTTEQYSSAIPEPFTFVPANQRSITLPDGSISSSFLELFGRPARDTGLEAERNNRPAAAQSLHLLNSSHIQKKLEESRNLQNLLQSKAPQRDIVSGLYLMILSRYPTEDELKTVANYSQSGKATGRDALIDVAWALINTTEFLYRH